MNQMQTPNEYLEQMQEALSDYEVNEDNHYDYLHEVIDTMVIYTSTCKQIINDLDYDIFQEHELGQAKSYEQAAFCALYDLYTRLT